MNGAERLCEVLLANGIDTCFANPGTSEMHFVAALDRNAGMRCVLGLSEGVVTSAADGYARMADKPAATLLHLGPGLANGLANLHNARRARTPMVNIVGDHASYHLAYDAPLTSDIEALARPMSDWVGRATSAADIYRAASEACARAKAQPGICTLILPADAAWNAAPEQTVEPAALPLPAGTDIASLEDAASALNGLSRVGILLGGMALRETALRIAGTIAVATGARLFASSHNARIERGSGRVPVERIPYPVDFALECLAGIDTLILVGAQAPVAFFAYPGKPSRTTREDCRIIPLAVPGQDLPGCLEALADRVGAGTSAALPVETFRTLDSPQDGALTADAASAIVAQLLPEGAIVCDESVTSGRGFFAMSQHSAPHDFLALTGGAIGIGIPLATGAAIAAPSRKVIGLQADGSGMYTVQGLWTQARERLDVVTVIFANRAYRILEGELKSLGVDAAGANARRMLELTDPALDWVSLAKGLGVEGVRTDTVSAFRRSLEAAISRTGPFLIEAVI